MVKSTENLSPRDHFGGKGALPEKDEPDEVREPLDRCLFALTPRLLESFLEHDIDLEPLGGLGQNGCVRHRCEHVCWDVDTQYCKKDVV